MRARDKADVRSIGKHKASSQLLLSDRGFTPDTALVSHY